MIAAVANPGRRSVAAASLMLALLAGCGPPTGSAVPEEATAAVGAVDAQDEASWWASTEVRSTSTGQLVLVPGDLLFASNSSVLSEAAAQTLQRVLAPPGNAARPAAEPAAVLAQSDRSVRPPRRTLEIRCFTDDSGDHVPGLNQQLSVRRAQAVVAAAVVAGWDPAAVRARGLGSNQPVDSNRTETGRARNRRCELRLR